jgi:hypothetical protein
MPLFGPPNVERESARGNIEGLVRAAGSRKYPEQAEHARRELEAMMPFLISELASKNLRKVVMCRDALKKIGRPATKALIEQLSDPMKERRQDAAHMLGEMRDPLAVKALIERLKIDNDQLVRQLACRSLGKLKERKALPALRLAVAGDPGISVRKTAAEAVAFIERRAPREAPAKRASAS